MRRPMVPSRKVMVLAAGRGERMQPLTAAIPKPAVPVLGRPLIREVLGRLSADGWRDVTLNLHHLPERLEAMLGDGSSSGLDALHYSLETDLLGTGGGLRHAERHLRGHGTILVRNSDFLADIDLEAALGTHLASGCPATLVMTGARDGYTKVPVDAAGHVLGFGDLDPEREARVAGRWLFTGYHFIEEEILDRLPADGPSDIVAAAYRTLAAERRLATHVADGFWWEFGTPATYLEGTLRLLAMDDGRRTGILDGDPVDLVEGHPVALGAGADLAGPEVIAGPCAIGARSRVEPGARVRESVVLSDAAIGRNARLTRCIVGPDAVVPSGADLADTIVCAGDRA